ncbi:hypothetical protein NMG60_11000371 [Bertholletia excelsa]
MSCCGGNCGCGSGCQCGSGCGGCKMYPELSHTEKTSTETLVLGVAPQKARAEGSETRGEEGEHGCKCNPCKCDPCNC